MEISTLPIFTDEQQLIHALKEGEASAMQYVFDTYYNLMFLTARNIVVDQEKAKDILQEVFEQLWVKRESLNIKVGLKPYLTRAVSNRAINEYKRLRKRNEINEFEDVEDGNNVQHQIEYEELNNEFQMVIEGLPEKCKAVFVKSRMEGKSHQEISDELGISKKTIENQITKALKRMRIALSNYNQLGIILVLINWLFRG